MKQYNAFEWSDDSQILDTFFILKYCSTLFYLTYSEAAACYFRYKKFSMPRLL